MSNLTTIETPAFQSWVAACQELINTNLQRTAPSLWLSEPTYGTLRVEEGRRYIKLLTKNSVWAFVDKTNGDILKPASWKAPAKHARGNVHDETNGMSSISPYGPAYLR